MDPESLLFSKSHEWIGVTDEGGEKIATFGISKFAVDALTDLVYMELPKVGQKVSSGTSCCEVESVKAVSDIYAPVSGEVIAVNEGLPDSLEKLQEDTYGEGWIAKIRMADEGELSNLMDLPAYENLCAEENH